MIDPYRGARQLTADKFADKALAFRGAAVNATVAGNVTLVLKDGSTIVVPVAVGFSKFDDFAVIGFTATGTTATATVYGLL